MPMWRRPLTGVLHTNVQGPVAATGKSGGVLRSGSASATSILGLIASGDASIRAAARNGGITEIHSTTVEHYGGLVCILDVYRFFRQN